MWLISKVKTEKSPFGRNDLGIWLTIPSSAGQCSSRSWMMRGVVCTNCSHSFPTKKSFVAHLISKSCVRSARTSRSRNKEESFQYPTNEVVPVQGCPGCRRFCRPGMQIYMLSHLTTHVRLDNNKNFKCDLCKMEFVTKTSLARHRAGHSRKHEECHYCLQKFKTVLMLQQHFEDCHQIKDCEECDFMTTSNSDLEDHMNNAHPQDSCDQCDMAFENDQALKEHKELIHVWLLVVDLKSKMQIF